MNRCAIRVNITCVYTRVNATRVYIPCPTTYIPPWFYLHSCPDVWGSTFERQVLQCFSRSPPSSTCCSSTSTFPPLSSLLPRLVSRFSPALAKLHQSDRHRDGPWNGDGTVMFLNVELSLAGLLKGHMVIYQARVCMCDLHTSCGLFRPRAGTMYVIGKAPPVFGKGD